MTNTSWSGHRAAFPPKLRSQILKRDKTCRICRTAKATEADHITNHADCLRQGINPDTLANGQGLCHDCHADKTRQEIAAGQARLKPRRVYRHPSDV
ncbi:MAG: HNH endonuclease [Propionibacteriaceae bacterium]|jgi:5-methylcytosine-specific restriction endonuclease McrA|nr:HNH endonuclease [Propionibacteriaceae bacterium]